jgi:arsenite methyltransferase
MPRNSDVKEFVKKRYGRVASKAKSCGPCSCPSDGIEQAMSIGYSDADLRDVPGEALAMGMGCGNPAAFADLKPGEVVLDLGSGGGMDVFLAAKKIGSKGKVIGVDMTDQMIEKATETASRYGYANVEFRKGEIENLPVEDESIDVVISNCVVNLTPDKVRAYSEVFRVLRPGGRLLISDLVTQGDIPEDIKRSFDAWADCIAGALEREEYLRTIHTAGFQGVTVVCEHPYTERGMDERLKGRIISVQVSAHKT